MSKLEVVVDNRVRLVAAALAASSWPEREQATAPHAVHSQARLTRQYVADYADHPAVTGIDAGLADGLAVADLFTAAVRCQWPTFDPLAPLPDSLADGTWIEQLADFYTDTAIAAFFWSDQEAVWETAVLELRAILASANLPGFLTRLAGSGELADIVVTPNLVYPALQAVVAHDGQQLVLILPPPRAVGESPPWNYGRAVDWVLAESCRQLLDAALTGQLTGLSAGGRDLLRHAATTLFLQRARDEAAAMAYLVQKRKQANLPELATVVDNLRDYVDNPNGRPLSDVIGDA